MSTLPGIDADNITRWLQERTAVVPPLRFELVQGGRSNLTYIVTDADGARSVLRRPPLGEVLESAHDMAREHRLISALESTDVPVPVTVGHEPSEDVTGAPFFVMEFVDGEVIRDEEAARRHLTPQTRQRASHDVADVLAALHAVDPDEVGLGDLAAREGYIARQLRRWKRQLAQSGSRDLPLLDEVHDRLASAIPEQRDVAIVHGDYRLDNLIVDPATGTVRAVLDWELTTLGDPLADVGVLLVYWSEAGDAVRPLGSAPTLVEGFLDRARLAERYATRSGRDLDTIGYYTAFAAWKLACILEGVYSRYASGAYGETDDSFRRFGDIVLQLGELASTSLGSHARDGSSSSRST